jgi:hypothetical protein
LEGVAVKSSIPEFSRQCRCAPGGQALCSSQFSVIDDYVDEFVFEQLKTEN